MKAEGVPLLLVLAVVFVVSGCAALPVSHADAQSTPPHEVPAADASPPADPGERVEFTLGPHRFALPRAYFVSQSGPDFQGGVTLSLLWPELSPYPLGQPYSAQTSGPMRNQRVSVMFDYIDRVPVDSVPGRSVTQDGELSSSQDWDYRARIRRPDQFGLELYVADLDRSAREHAAVLNTPLKPAENFIGTSPDWFVGRDASGAIRTVVKCDNAHRPEGFEIRDDRLVSLPGASRWPFCGAHSFVLPQFSVAVRTSYHRPLLRDWRRIEAEVRRLMDDAYARAQEHVEDVPVYSEGPRT